MAILEEKYMPTPGQYGLMVIEVSGRCTADEASGIRSGCTWKYEMVALPNASGAVLKSLDGTVPRLLDVRPSTIPITFRCVKVAGWVEPFAYVQPAGPYAGKAILRFRIRYQEVGGVA